jgi:hypothetical protein
MSELQLIHNALKATYAAMDPGSASPPEPSAQEIEWSLDKARGLELLRQLDQWLWDTTNCYPQALRDNVENYILQLDNEYYQGDLDYGDR